MSRPRKPGRLTAADVATISALFDPASRDSALAQIQEAGDPVPAGWRAALAATIETHLLSHMRRYRALMFESGRGRNALEFETLDDFERAAENVASLLRIAEGGTMDAETAHGLARDLETAWLGFAAEATAHRMYDDLAREVVRERENLGAANDQRRRAADTELLARFIAWQRKAGPHLQRVGATTAQERVRRFKCAVRPLPDRDTRRLMRLLREGRIPPL